MEQTIEPTLQRNYPMRLATSLGVGGPADYFFRPRSAADIQWALRFAEERQLPLTTIGYGTNLLVRDGGIAGIVIQLADSFAAASVHGSTITATCGCLYGSVSKLAAYHSLSGLEYAVGIPGGLGGALFMNAGAYDGEIGPLVREVHWVTAHESGVWHTPEYTYSYRFSRLQEANVIVTKTVLQLQPGDQQAIYAKMNDLQERRRCRQPLEYPSAGSTFKRPEGHFVGSLIEQANLKGYSIGGAQISEKHCGFIINRGGATAGDVLQLIDHIQKVIADQFGVELQPEIRIIGRQRLR